MNRAVVLLALAALGLRAWRLDGQSLWYDEGISVALAQRDLLTIARNAAADIHPPLYYYLLHIWTPLVGQSEFAVRWLSVAIGTLLPLLTYRVGRLYRNEAGLLAAFFVAVSPILVYYSQEARMYILMASLGALAAYLAARVLHDARPSYRLWVAYVAIAILTAYSHYYGLTVLLALNLYAAVVIAFGNRRRALPWLAANGIAALAFTPWAWLSWNQLRGWPAISQPLDGPALVNKIFLAFSFGFAPPAEAWPSAALVIMLLGAPIVLVLGRFNNIPFSLKDVGSRGPQARRERGDTDEDDSLRHSEPLSVGQEGTQDTNVAVALRSQEIATHPDPLPGVEREASFRFFPRGGRANPRSPSSLTDRGPRGEVPPRFGLLLAGLLASIPVLALYFASLQRPMYNPKFLLAAVPGYLLFLALGGEGWRHLIGSVLGRLAFRPRKLLAVTRAVAGIILALAVSLPAVQALVIQETDPRLARDDYRGIVRYIDSSWREGDAILLNAPGQVEIFSYYHPDLSVVYPLPAERPLDEAGTVAALEQIGARHKRVWTILWATQQADPQGIVERWLDTNAYKSLSRWYGGVRLALYTVPGTDTNPIRPISQQVGNDITLVGYSLEGEVVQPGEVAGVNLYWRADRPVTERYKVFVQLLDPQEYLWGQHDSEPSGGSRPTVSWKAGEQVADRHGLPVPLGTPPGRYGLIVGMYHPVTGQRLAVPADPLHNRIMLGSIVVERPLAPPTLEMLRPQRTVNAPLGDDLALLGYDLFRYGTDNTELRAGEAVLLSLYWQARRAPAADYDLEVALKDSQGKPLQAWRGQPANGNYPSSQWQAGEVVRDQHRLETNAPGEYTIAVSIKRGESTVGTMDIGKMVVR